MSQPVPPADAVDRPAARLVWPGYAAAGWAALFALVSLYWAVGGTAGIRTVGGDIAALAGSGSGAAGLLAWGATVLKVAGVVFALALVSRWGRIFPRPLMLVAGWAASVVLILYGAVNVLGELLVVTGIVPATSQTDLYALHWHLALWDPYFLVWGILLLLAVRQYQRATRG